MSSIPASPSSVKVPHVCRQCGREFIPTHPRRPCLYCGLSCAAAARYRPLAPRICRQCGETFTPHTRGHLTYCSPACQTAAQRAKTAKVAGTCGYCGATYTRFPCALGTYCSRACGYAAQKAGRIARFWANVQKTDTCWLWQGRRDTDGYGSHWTGRRNERAHRFSYTLHYGPIPPALLVCHRCDTPSCVRPDHLFLGTQRENRDDCTRKGRNATGERNGLAKLTTAQVAEIRARFAAGETNKAILGRVYGITGQNVGHILRGVTWKAPSP
jgi:hypothetical protein